MKASLNKCPVCGEDLIVARYHCESCDTTIEGRFENSAFPGLTGEQIEFVKTFVRNEGKINRMEEELNLSYPSIRNLLHGCDPRHGLRAGQGWAAGSQRGKAAFSARGFGFGQDHCRRCYASACAARRNRS